MEITVSRNYYQGSYRTCLALVADHMDHTDQTYTYQYDLCIRERLEEFHLTAGWLRFTEYSSAAILIRFVSFFRDHTVEFFLVGLE